MKSRPKRFVVIIVAVKGTKWMQLILFLTDLSSSCAHRNNPIKLHANAHATQQLGWQFWCVILNLYAYLGINTNCMKWCLVAESAHSIFNRLTSGVVSRCAHAKNPIHHWTILWSAPSTSKVETGDNSNVPKINFLIFLSRLRPR